MKNILIRKIFLFRLSLLNFHQSCFNGPNCTLVTVQNFIINVFLEICISILEVKTHNVWESDGQEGTGIKEKKLNS